MSLFHNLLRPGRQKISSFMRPFAITFRTTYVDVPFGRLLSRRLSILGAKPVLGTTRHDRLALKN